MNWFGHSIVKVYYEFKTRKNVSPTGDYVDPGIWWTRNEYNFLDVQADNVWYESDAGWIENPRDIELLTPEENTWLHMKARPLGWEGAP